MEKLKLIFAGILFLVFASGIVAGGVVRPDDSYPVKNAFYRAGSTTYSGADIEIVSMSLKAASSADTIVPSSLGSGEFTVESFFDVFVELSVNGEPPLEGILNGAVHMYIKIPPGGSDVGTFDTEIVAMDLRGQAGEIPIILRAREAASGMATGERTVSKTGDGTYHIDSFFDVFTEISIDGGQTWSSADGPTHIELSGVQVGEFNAVVEGNMGEWNILNPELSGGDGWAMPGTSERWFAYPQEEPITDDRGNVEQGPYGATWWNEWWYDDPYDPDRVKKISISFNYELTDPQQEGYAKIAVNWSTTDWSLNPPGGVNPSLEPPLSDFDPANPSVAWVGRWDIMQVPLNPDNPSGTFTLRDVKLPVPYNPEWVSIDIRGYNFMINGGRFVHECVLDTDRPPVIEQLDWVGLSSSTPDSSWGRIALDYNRPAGIYYFNLSVDSGMGTVGAQWAVQNMSIESPGGDDKIMTYFDLGVPDGTDVSSVNYGYSITSVPVTSPPPVSGTTSVPDVKFQIGTEDGQDLGTPKPAPKPADKTAIAASNDPNSGVIPDKDKFVNQAQKPNQCAPGAISNSLKYLQARGGVSSTLPTSISDVGSVIGTDADGTPASWYKKKKTHYKDHVNVRWVEAPLTVAKVQDLVKELKDGQDIEMDLKGHVEVLAGIRLKKDGTVDLDLYDDNQTDDKSDPMHTSTLMTDGTNQIVDGMVLERFVIECPKETTTVGISDFSLNTFDEWMITLNGGYPHGSIIPMDEIQWQEYMGLWNNPDLLEDPALPYPENQFMPPELYVYEGDNNPEGEDPDDGGLVMAWGDPAGPPQQASAWKYKYEPDPDLSNSIITVSVTAPQFGAGGGSGQVNQVSLGLETPPAGGGNIRSWYWNCGPVGSGAPIEWGVPTTITIDTSVTGTAAASPVATNYVSAPGFSISNVQWIIVDENASWVGGSTPAPGPGGAPVFMWNYWHWLMVTPKTSLTKALITKHSQGPVIIDGEVDPDPDVPLFWGWDEISDYHVGPIAADDWECRDKRPVTDFHWWGSFPGWREPYPPCKPKAFHIGIWTDVPASADDPESYSHPGKLVWEHFCENYTWNFAGYDRDPRNFDPRDPAGGGVSADDPSQEPADACFQYNQLLDGDDWFYQEPMDDGTPRIYWLSIAPIWAEDCDYKWGWKTRPKYFMDNAVSIRKVQTVNADGTTSVTWPPVVGSEWSWGVPLQIPAYDPQNGQGHADAVSWDLAFEISTNEKTYQDDPIPGDIGGPNGEIPDGVVDIHDLAVMARHWQERFVAVP